MNTQDITLHQIAPIIGAILEERSAWEKRAHESMREGDYSAAADLFQKSAVVDTVLQRVIDAATGGTGDA